MFELVARRGARIRARNRESHLFSTGIEGKLQ